MAEEAPAAVVVKPRQKFAAAAEDVAEEAIEEESAAVQIGCRMYEAQFPEVDDLVVVQVVSIAEMGAYVRLLEYNNVEGMILLSELSRRRIRSISKLIRVGRQETVMVLRVDEEKGEPPPRAARAARPAAYMPPLLSFPR